MNESKTRLYICNRKMCGQRCHPECTHTSNINYAVNFEFDGYAYIEKDYKDRRDDPKLEVNL